jgi:hypothetical protein
LKSLIYSRLGDDDIRDGNTPVDPALKLYVGCHCLINGNCNVKEGLANGTMCRVISIRRKENTPMGWRNYDGKKVFFINVNEIDYIEFEHYPPSSEQRKILEKMSILEKKHTKENDTTLVSLKTRLDQISKQRRFRLKPKNFYPVFSYHALTKNCSIPKKHQMKMKAKIKQIPVILNDATTGYKLQGSSKNQIILQTIDYGTNGWIYTALSRVRSLEGLFLSSKIDFKKFVDGLKKTITDLAAFDRRMKAKVPRKAGVP